MNQTKEKLILSPEEAREIIYGYDTDYEIIQKNFIESRRWVSNYSCIIKRKSDNKYFKTIYEVGNTEEQDVRPYEDETEVIMDEVFQIEKTIVVYE